MDSPVHEQSQSITTGKNDIRDIISFFEKDLKCSETNEGVNSKLIQNRANSDPNFLDIKEQKKTKANVSRTLTEIRKNYARRMRNTVKKKERSEKEDDHLFECCLLVELDMSTLQPYIKGKYPPNVSILFDIFSSSFFLL